MSLDASGTMSRTITYQRGGVVRLRNSPGQQRAAARGNARQRFAAASRVIAHLTPQARATIRAALGNPTAWRAATIAHAIGPQAAIWSAAISNYNALSVDGRTTWQRAARAAGITTAALPYASQPAPTPAEALYAIAQMYSLSGAYPELGQPADDNAAAWLLALCAVVMTTGHTWEFDGETLPAGWQTGQYNPPAGETTVNNGQLTVAGTYASEETTTPAPQTVTIRAKFSGTASGQHIGLNGATDLNDGPWAIVSTSGGGTLYARTLLFGDAEETYEIGPASLDDEYHIYTITYTASSITYGIDGTTVRTVSHTTAPAMRAIISSVNADTPLTVDWIDRE